MYNKVLTKYGSKNLCLGVTQNSQLGFDGRGSIQTHLRLLYYLMHMICRSQTTLMYHKQS